MDKFYLVLIKKDGTIVHDIFATTHDDLVYKYLSPEEVQEGDYFKSVFSPKEGFRLDDLEGYDLVTSEVYFPDWFTGEFRLQIISDLKDIISSMIVRGRKKLLLHEGVILTNMSVIDEVKHCIIFGMYDEARIDNLACTSVVQMMTDDSQILKMKDSSRVNEMYGFAKVKEMRDYSKVLKMIGQTKIGYMFEHSRIGVLKGDANIMKMVDDAQADRLKHMSRVDEMHGHTVIEEMWDWTVVEKMFDNARINFMDEESKVLEMYGDSMVDQMHGNAVVEKLYENSLVKKLNDMAKILEKDLD